jgi:hypothetical protein
VALMALSMDEERVLAEIERRLSAEEPRLAACMSSFRRPGPSVALRTPRARILGSLFTVMLVAMISLMVYAVIPFRGVHTARTPGGSPGSSAGQTSLTASGSSTQGSVGIRSVPSARAAKTGTHTTAAAATGVTAHAKSAPSVKGTVFKPASVQPASVQPASVNSASVNSASKTGSESG